MTTYYAIRHKPTGRLAEYDNARCWWRFINFNLQIPEGELFTATRDKKWLEENISYDWCDESCKEDICEKSEILKKEELEIIEIEVP